MHVVNIKLTEYVANEKFIKVIEPDFIITLPMFVFAPAHN